MAEARGEATKPSIVAPDDAGIVRAAALLADGQLVGIPTETVYGLACHAFDAEAAARVFAAKRRPSFDPLIVHVASEKAAWQLAAQKATAQKVPEPARALAEAFWPGPLTLVLPKPGVVPGIVTSGLETVGLRVPAHPVARRLIAALGEELRERGARGTTAPSPARVGGVAAPSANVFGGVSPSRAEHVSVKCALVLDGGPCATGVESTVVRPHSDGSVTVLRLGGTTLEQLAEVIGEANMHVAQPGDRVTAPGMTERHYAPRTPLTYVEELEQLEPASLGNQRVGLISFTGERGRGMGFAAAEVLSARGDLVEAAANLFAALHRLDAAGLDRVVAEAVPEEGLGRAINDRLRRASS